MKKPPLFSVIIVNWNTCPLTLQAIRSVYAQGEEGVEVIVVDNASSDDSVERIRTEFPDVRLVVNSANLGYARANNLAMQIAKGDYFVLLNSDAELITPGTFAKLHQVFQSQPNVAVIGAKLIFPSGKVQSVGRQFLTLKRVIQEQIFFASVKAVRPTRIEYVDGAFMAVRRTVFEQLGGLNERLFMYGEDREWCFRILQNGRRIIVLKEIVVKHRHGASTKQNFREMLMHSLVNDCRWLVRHAGLAEAKLAYDVYLLGMALRIPLSLVRRKGLVRDYISGLIAAVKMRPRLRLVLKKHYTRA
ncbi:MAG: glycosyltransferase family 2 protein [candidate division KSB1 bacterium]|nr:glycosyltransferase family 2 protein [candidate division KSB1 bacterium]MDZ7345815.1 glycosyltransferase family 2 protein [candidate division KSB1 bacterium]